MVSYVAKKDKDAPEKDAPEGPSQPGSTFTYIGDPKDDFGGPSEMPVWGTTFKKGVPQFVPADQMIAARKKSLADILRGHSHFVEGEDQVDGEKQELELAGLRAELKMRKIKFDRHDGVEKLKELLGRRG